MQVEHSEIPLTGAFKGEAIVELLRTLNNPAVNGTSAARRSRLLRGNESLRLVQNSRCYVQNIGKI